VNDYKYFVYPETALNCLVGLPHSNVWETTVTGYRATIWDDDEPVFSKSNFNSYSDAKRWCKTHYTKPVSGQ